MIWNEACREIWRYIKENNLQDPNDKSMIKCDAKLEAMTKKKSVSGKEIPKIVTANLTHDPEMEVRKHSTFEFQVLNQIVKCYFHP